MKKILSKMIRLGLNPKKEFLLISAIDILLIVGFVVAGIFAKNLIFYGIGPGFAVIFTILFLSRYDSMISKINLNNLLEFCELFGFFRIYIKNGYNVYTALKEITNFANEDLRKMIENLLIEIDENKSVQPFIKFAKNFDEIIIEELMLSIYQMIDDGEQSNYLVQFNFIFDKFSEDLAQKQLSKKDKKLGTLSSAPLVGSCFLIIVITLGIIGVIGEIANGI